MLRNIQNIYPSEDFNVYLQVTDKEGQLCSKTNLDKYNDEQLFINSIQKCRTATGTESLEKIAELSNVLDPNIKRNCLLDASSLKLCRDSVKIPLDVLNILSTGESWYNKLGFRSDSYEEEITKNATFISKLFSDALDEAHKAESTHRLYEEMYDFILKNKKDEEKERDIWLLKDKCNNEIYSVIQEVTQESRANIVQNLTVQQVFIKVKAFLQGGSKTCTPKFVYNASIVGYLLHIFQEYVFYDWALCKELVNVNNENESPSKKRKTKMGGSKKQTNKRRKQKRLKQRRTRRRLLKKTN